MSANKLALIRYKIIDECLKNRHRKWTLEDLIDKVSDRLYEFEGIDSGVSKRTIQQDIQDMRSEKIGYNAPIVVYDRKYYKYEDKNYSITNLPISASDIEKLNESVNILKQFNGFNYFEELTEIIAKIESKVYSSKNSGQSFIDFEKNELLKGLKYLHPLHKALLEKKAILLEYKSFKAKSSSSFIAIPYLLKEYRNRWFILGVIRNKPEDFLIFALDRIVNIEILTDELYIEKDPDFIMNYFNDTIGVSRYLKQRPQRIVFKINSENSPYVKTKPFHKSQKIIEENKEFTTFVITVVWNFELEREILGFGESIEVISPLKLRRKIAHRVRETLEKYENSKAT